MKIKSYFISGFWCKPEEAGVKAPAEGEVAVFINGGANNQSQSYNTNGARPSINLQSGITINGGTGTSTDAFVLS